MLYIRRFPLLLNIDIDVRALHMNDNPAVATATARAHDEDRRWVLSLTLDYAYRIAILTFRRAHVPDLGVYQLASCFMRVWSTKSTPNNRQARYASTIHSNLTIPLHQHSPRAPLLRTLSLLRLAASQSPLATLGGPVVPSTTFLHNLVCLLPAYFQGSSHQFSTRPLD